MMKYKKMLVWCCGSKNAGMTKRDLGLYTFMGVIDILMWFVLAFMQFGPYVKDGSGRFTAFIICSLIIIGILIIIIINIKHSLFWIKMNKVIPLFIFNHDEYKKLETIPDELFILYNDVDGIVLAFKKYKEESEYFSIGGNTIREYIRYYTFNAYRSEEIITSRNTIIEADLI